MEKSDELFLSSTPPIHTTDYVVLFDVFLLPGIFLAYTFPNVPWKNIFTVKFYIKKAAFLAVFLVACSFIFEEKRAQVA